MSAMKEWKVSSEESGQKLLVFLKSRCPDHLSLRRLKKSVEEGLCRINGKTERFASTLVGFGDRIIFCDDDEQSVEDVAWDASERFIHIDQDLVAYNKPAGMLSEDKKLLLLMKQQFGPHTTLLHRLDRDTTGVLLFGRNDHAIEKILEAFKNREITKTYLAIVDGVPKQTSGIIENFLGKISTYQGQSIWGAVDREKGQHASTCWKMEKAAKKEALLICHPETGRTHQLRVHLSGMGHPILGDHHYARSFVSLYRPRRLLLHAAEIALAHPRDHVSVTIKAPLPNDFTQAITDLFGNR